MPSKDAIFQEIEQMPDKQNRMTMEQLTEITKPLDNRISAIETELAQLKELFLRSPLPAQHTWWTTVFGSFADCPDFDEMEELGQTWRNAQNDMPDLD